MFAFAPQSGQASCFGRTLRVSRGRCAGNGFRARFDARLSAAVFDPSASIQTENLKAVLSSSQANALAVSIFLALNLGARYLPFGVVDDPLQSLDDVNLLGLIDVLRRVRETRQLIVSTHDVRFVRLLERKLRPVKDSQRTRVIDFQGRNREGPVVTDRTVILDQEPLRIAV
jgi:predicted ATPase